MLSLDLHLDADSTQMTQFSRKQYIASRRIYPRFDGQSFSDIDNSFFCIYIYIYIIYITHCRRLCKTTKILVKKKYVFLFNIYSNTSWFWLIILIYIYIYIYTCVYIYICMYIYIYMYIYDINKYIGVKLLVSNYFKF